MQKVDLAVQVRTDTGKRATKALRLTGAVPASLYGPARDSALSISVDRRELEKVTLSHSTVLINLAIEGDTTVQALLKSHDQDPVRGHLIHADFYEVTANQALHTTIPIEVTGNSAGVKEGGILERAIREIEIECLPRHLPENITVDVTDMEIGHSIHVRDLELPEGVTVRHPEPATTLIQVVPPRVIEEEAPVEEEGLEGIEGAEGVEGAEPAEGAEGAPAAKDGKDGKDGKDAKGGKGGKGGRDAKSGKEGGGD